MITPKNENQKGHLIQNSQTEIYSGDNSNQTWDKNEWENKSLIINNSLESSDKEIHRQVQIKGILIDAK